MSECVCGHAGVCVNMCTRVCVSVASIELEEFDRVAELDRSGPLIVRWHKAASVHLDFHAKCC